MSEAAENTIYQVAHPEAWTLALRINEKGLEFTIHNAQIDKSLMFGALPFSDTANGYASNLENTVYDNSFLLQPFGKTIVVADSDRFLLLPDEMTGCDDNEYYRYYNCIYPDDNRNLMSDHIKDAGLSIVYGINRDVDSFLRRTFYNPPTVHCLTPLIAYFKRNDAYSGRNRMFVYITDSQAEIITLKSGRVAFANVFPFKCADDAFYYIVNAWSHCEMSHNDDDMIIVGDSGIKQLLTPRLREAAHNVSQMILPADILRLGDNVMSAPFDLIISQICE